MPNALICGTIPIPVRTPNGVRMTFIPRSCPVPIQVCVAYGTSRSIETDSMKIKFKNLPDLGDSEADSFLVRGRQAKYDGENVTYELKQLRTTGTYIVSQRRILGIFKADGFVIKEK